MLRATGTARANNNQVRNRVDNRTHITVTPYIARSVHPTVRAAGGAPDKHKAAPPPRHPRQPWRWSSNLRRPVAELPTANPGSSTPQHRCRSGSTPTRPGVCTPTGWCRIPAERTRRAITKATTCSCPRPTAAQPQRLAHWPWHARRACRCSLRHQDSDEDPRRACWSLARSAAGRRPCPGPRADDCVPEVLVGVGLRFGPVVGGVLGAVVYDKFIGPPPLPMRNTPLGRTTVS